MKVTESRTAWSLHYTTAAETENQTEGRVLVRLPVCAVLWTGLFFNQMKQLGCGYSQVSNALR